MFPDDDFGAYHVSQPERTLEPVEVFSIQVSLPPKEVRDGVFHITLL